MITNIYFVCNKDQIGLLPKGVNYISTNSSLQDLLNQNEFSNTGFIILAETKWTNRYYTDFVGLDLIFQLRAIYQLRIPIILTSFYPSFFQDFINEQSAYEYQRNLRFFKDPSILFHAMPHLLNTEFTKLCDFFAEPIDHLFHQDLLQNVYELSGYFRHHLQLLEEAIYALANETIERINLLILFGNQLKRISKSLHVFTKLADKEFYLPLEQKTFSKKEAVAALQTIREEIEQFLKKENQIKHNNNNLVIRTMYIGNEPLLQKNIKERFAGLGIYTQTFSVSDELIKSLECTHDIGVVLCDLRFYDDLKRFSREQGYHIYKKVIQQLKKMYEFIFIADLDSIKIPTYLNKQNITIFPKKWITKGNAAFPKLAQLVIEKDLLLKEKNEKLPAFGKAMELYFKHLNDDLLEEVEKEISQCALDIILAILSGEITNLPIIPKISGALNNKDEKKNLKNFRSKLKARRVVLGLSQLPTSKLLYYKENESKWRIIYSILKGGVVRKTSLSVNMQAIHSFVSKHLLKMQTKESYHWRNAYDYNLTPQERLWLLDYGDRIENGDF